MHTTLISPSELAAQLQSASPPLVFDCSHDLSDPSAGARQFEQAHIPGAIHAHLDQYLSDKGQPPNPQDGRHPLPSPARFDAWLQDSGLAQDQQVVVYDRQGANYCGRLWWMLKSRGHEAVALLDGGLQAWQAEDNPVASGAEPFPRAPAETPFIGQQTLVNTATTADIASRLGAPNLTVIDARAPARFRGETEPLDPVAGHIPGALNRPFSLNLDANGRFKAPAQLRQEFETLLAGRDPSSVVHHCGSGVSAVPNLLGMAIAGMGMTTLYPGSWSAWCNTPGTPRAKG